MKNEEKIKMFNDVFAPKPKEKVLFLVDTPHDDIKDSEAWKDRREMAKEWYKIFKDMGEKNGFSVDLIEFPATGIHNTPLPKNIIDLVLKYNLVLAITEFSASSSLFNIVKSKNSITRCASMPSVERRMEKTAFKADYKKVQKYATEIKKILDNAIAADITFSTGDTLHIDLRNRSPKKEAGECFKPGQMINFPSGEAWMVPYEAAPDEIDIYGESKTEGVWPVDYSGEQVKYVIKNNIIIEIKGEGKKAKGMRKLFEENETRRNLAELGIGCNPKAVVTGNLLEDEKVGGLHLAYGMSTHIGGKVDSDMHYDISYPKGAPIEAVTLTIINKDGTKIDLIKNSLLQYKLFR
jgi:hypothetical protein